MSYCGIYTIEHTKQKDISMFHKMCPIKRAKNMFMSDFGQEHTKALELVNAQVCQEIIVFPN